MRLRTAAPQNSASKSPRLSGTGAHKHPTEPIAPSHHRAKFSAQQNRNIAVSTADFINQFAQFRLPSFQSLLSLRPPAFLVSCLSTARPDHLFANYFLARAYICDSSSLHPKAPTPLVILCTIQYKEQCDPPFCSILAVSRRVLHPTPLIHRVKDQKFAFFLHKYTIT
jgi:hypothetical protein